MTALAFCLDALYVVWEKRWSPEDGSVTKLRRQRSEFRAVKVCNLGGGIAGGTTQTQSG